MPWVVKSDHGKPSEGMSWQDFQQKHKLVPYLNDMALQYRQPLLADLPPKVVRETYEMYGKMDPLSYQDYIRVILGIIIPLDQMDEFVKRLESAYNALAGE